MDGAGGECTQILSANVGDLVELRLSNLEERGSRRSYHSMHMHGYEFFLMSMGFAQYENGTIIGDNENVKCRKTPCAFLDYDEEVLKREREERTSFIAKNSILVPPQGYAIVRFRATNPGIWPIHCHQGVHLDGGMSALIEIKDDVQNRPFSYLPPDFPRCGNFEPETNLEIFGSSSAVQRIFSSLIFLILKLF